MNIRRSKTLGTHDFMRMFECEAKTDLEIELFDRLNEIFDLEDTEIKAAKLIESVYDTHDDILETVENTLDDLETTPEHADHMSDSLAKLLHDLSVSVSDERSTAKADYDKLELLGLWDQG